MMRLVLIVEETGWFYSVHAAVSEADEFGRTSPVMSQDVCHAKADVDGLEGILDAVKAVLFA